MHRNSGIAVLIVSAVAVGAFLLVGSRDADIEYSVVTIRDVAFSVEVANAPAARAQGLSGRPTLPEGEGMLFLFDVPGQYRFWMKGMRFPIGIIWVRGRRIVGITENAVPELGKSDAELAVYHPVEPVDAVLEVNSGVVARHSFQIGDAVAVE